MHTAFKINPNEFNRLAALQFPIVHHHQESLLFNTKFKPLSNLVSNVSFSIRTRIHVAENPMLPLNFVPSLNYLVVIGGGDNSKRRGAFCEYEFQNNALNHLCWWLTASEENYGHCGLIANDRNDFESLFHSLMKCHLIDQFLKTKQDGNNKAAAKEKANVLFDELIRSGYLLLHSQDDSHAFYIEIEKIQASQNQFTIHIYNTGKGIFLHQSRYVDGKLKFFTKKSFFGVSLDEKKLTKIIFNIDDQARNNLRPRIPIYMFYFLFSIWQKSRIEIDSSQPVQAKQKFRDCQQKTLLSVIKHKLSPRAYKIFKATLLLRTITLSNPPTNHSKTIIQRFTGKDHLNLYKNSVERAQEKAARTLSALN